MTFDTHSLFAYSSVVTVVSQSASTLVIAVGIGDGSRFATGQQVILAAPLTQTLISNSMIGRITGISGDQLTIDITSANREGSNVRTVQVLDTVINGITPKIFTDIEGGLNTIIGNLPSGAIVGLTDVQALTHKTITDATNNVAAKSLVTSGGNVDISGGGAPTAGQIPVATDSSHLIFKNPSGILQSIQSSQTVTNSTNNTTSGVIMTSVTFTPIVPADLVILINGTWYNTATQSNVAYIALDGVKIDAANAMNNDFATANKAATFGGSSNALNVSAASHTVAIYFAESGGGVATIEGANLTVLVFNH